MKTRFYLKIFTGGFLLLVMLSISGSINAQNPPVASCQDIIVYLNPDGTATLYPSDIDDGSYDPDGEVVELHIYLSTVDCDDAGTTVPVELYVDDGVDAQSTCTANVFVVDQILPVASCMPLVYVELDEEGEAEITPGLLDMGSYDECSSVTLDISKSLFGCADLGYENVTLTVTDEAGNSSSCVSEVLVEDYIEPVVYCNPHVDVYLNNLGYAEVTIDDLGASADENCGIVTFALEGRTTFDCLDIDASPLGVDVVGYDGSLNEGRCTSDIYVHDNLAPVISSCPVDITIGTDPGECTASSTRLIEPDVTDNCHVVLENDAPDVLPVGTTVVEWEAYDAYNAPVTCSQNVTVADMEPPVLSGCPGDVAVSCYSEVPPVASVTAVDNCSGTVAVVYNATETDAGSSCMNTITRTWIATDEYGNTSSCSQYIYVNDDVSPTIICAPDVMLASDAGQCTYTVSGSEFDAVANDNCSTIALDWTVTGATPSSGSTTLDGQALNFGLNVIEWTATDDCGNTATCIQNVDVVKITTITEVTVTPSTQQYSDPVTFTATIQPGVCPGAGQAATHVTFYVGAQPMGDPVLLTVDGDQLVGTATYPLLEYPGYEGSMDPDPALNPKLVTAVFIGVDSDFDVEDPTTNLTIIPENACAIYAGVCYASTGSIDSDEALVVLAATIVEEDDGYPGDFYNTALVQFLADSRMVAEVPIVPLTPVDGELPVGEIGSDAAIGAASYEWNGVLTGVYDILTNIIGYYTNDPSGDCDGEGIVTVGKPSSDFISGGGYVVLEEPMGLAAGDVGSKNNFGFNVKYNKKLTNLQGKINTIIRRTETDGLHVYQAKGNVMTSLTVNDNKAVFTGRCSLQDITDPDYPVDVAGGGGATMQFTMTDNGEPGSDDLISITVWKRDGGLWFTNQWDAVAYLPVEQVLDGGNLVVHSAKEEEASSGKPPKKKSGEIAESNVLQNHLVVYPNPFTQKLYFELVPAQNSMARIDMFDITGRLVQTVFDKPVSANIRYKAIFEPEKTVSSSYVYRITIGNSVKTGKVVYLK